MRDQGSKPRSALASAAGIAAKAALVSIAIGLIAYINIGLIRFFSSQLSLQAFLTVNFITDFVVVMVIIVIYDSITAGSALTDGFYGAIAVCSLIVFTGLVSPPTSTNVLIIDILYFFAALLAVFTLVSIRYVRIVLQFSAAIFVFVLLVKLGSGSIDQLLNYNLLPNSLSNQTPYIGNASGSYSIDPMWVSLFMANLSAYRMTNLSACSNLAQFSKIRFDTMTNDSHWMTSHYGYDNDAATYFNSSQFPMSVVVYQAEEYFYPDQAPSQFLQYVKRYAPIHFSGLINSTYRYYGYYIGNGPTFQVQSTCPVTEIPGPDIYLPSFYRQYNCSYSETNATWLVMELSNSCPTS